jgi:hypothetical protein
MVEDKSAELKGRKGQQQKEFRGGLRRGGTHAARGGGRGKVDGALQVIERISCILCAVNS